MGHTRMHMAIWGQTYTQIKFDWLGARWRNLEVCMINRCIRSIPEPWQHWYFVHTLYMRIKYAQFTIRGRFDTTS